MNRRRDAALERVRAQRPGWWVAPAHVVPALFRALVDDGRYVAAFERERAAGVVVTAGPEGVELWDRRSVVPVVRWRWEHLGAVLPGPGADTRRGTRPAMRVETVAGTSIPLVLAAGRGWRAAPQAQVDEAVAALRRLRDGS